MWARHREVNILHEYAEQGRKINIMFIAMIYFVIFVNVTQLVLSKIIDDLLKNGTEPGKFPTHVDYYHIDTQKYYFYTMMYYCLMLFIIAMVIITNNVMLISYVQHASGIFAALGHKLELIGNNDTAIKIESAAYAVGKRDVIQLAWCVDRHNDAIEYANLIETIYTWNVFVVITIGMFLINILGLEVLINTSDPEAATKFIMFALSVIFLFFIDCYFAQILMDHSINIRFCLYNCRWYRLPLEAQKLLQLMTMRCIVSCQLTAGKMLILSIRSFGVTIRTTASYFTMVRSTQGL